MTLAAWAVCLLASAPADPPTVFPPGDFVEYWSAARVHARGGDPYDGAQLLPYQREAAGDPAKTEATMLWTPPWTLPLYLPFGHLEPRAAHLAWLAVQVGCVLLSAWLVWRAFGGPAGKLWPLAPLAVALTFAPVGWLVGFGQNTGFVTLGLAGFLYLRGRGYPVAAGAAAALTAVKPHLLALFGLALLLDATTRCGRRVLIGGAVALAAGAVVALVPDPDVFRQFADALRRPRTAETVPLSYWQVPTVGYKLRVAAAGGVFQSDPGELFWVQFVPLAVGCGLLLPYWWVRRKAWDWSVELPRLVFASVLLAPYGAWIFDLTVLLVPVVAAWVRVLRRPRFVPVVFAAATHALLSLATVLAIGCYPRLFGEPYGLYQMIWVAPAVLVWCVVVTLLSRPTVNPPTEDQS
jgi:hypothetical protein